MTTDLTRALDADAAHRTAADHAATADTTRSLTPDTVRAIVAAGFAHWFTPERWGGAAGSFTELTAAVARVGEACASAAWCASLAAYGARHAACLPLAGQEEVWASGPDAFLVSAVVPAGRAAQAPGGWRLTGRWPYVSAVAHADHAVIAARLPDGAVWYFAVPPRDYTVEHTWFTVGMRGTGSDTVVLDDVFVPAHRGFDRAALVDGRPVGTTAPCHTTAQPAIAGLPFAAPILGAGRAAVAAAAVPLAARQDDQTVQIGVSRAAAQVDAAELLLHRLTTALDSGAPPGPSGARDITLAVELVTDAVNRLCHLAGTSGHSQNAPLERIWRDVNTAAGHGGLRPERSAAAYAAQLLGGPR
ncbi:MAG TPA: acyl-CoA dehydrogenase family protein [Pseudonocardiaceae bacterium]|nr:acyl-CoA dehydrogenase family protein [Pseudonocardiaceae bacterium]